MADEKKMVPGINVGERVRVRRNGDQYWMTGEVIRNDDRLCEVVRDDVPPHKTYRNNGGSMTTLVVEEEPLHVYIFGENDAGYIKDKNIRVEKITN